MRSALLALLLLAVVAAPADAVVAGTPADRADFPFFAVVGGGCGGALVTPTRVLTAAHCREVLGSRAVVRIGPRDERRTVRRRALHPVQFRELGRIQREFPPPAADLMLLELDRPVTDVAPARIARTAPAAGTAAVTIGRGATENGGEADGIFRQGTVQVQAPGSCSEQLDTPLLRAWSVCTRDPRMADPSSNGPFVSACNGDSGGPLLVAGAVVGVVSWGPACGSERDPEIYANAARGRSWALGRTVVWAPEAIGRARLTGVARVGRTLTCRVRWLVRPTRRLAFTFTVDGFQKQEGRRPTFVLGASTRGHRVQCSAGGETAGGRGGPPGLSRARTVH